MPPEQLTRRGLIGGLALLGPGAAAPGPTIADLARHPLLRRFSNRPVGPVDTEGRAGLNVGGFNTIEEQRQGADWILRGLVTARPEWVATGWRVLDYGISRQKPDGGFSRAGYLHANALFVEALARACLLDPENASAPRRSALRMGARWLMRPSRRDLAINAPYTHRLYILAAAIGQAGAVGSDREASAAAERWAADGLALQRPDGTNPELGGFDANYQMVGPLYACRYLPVCASPAIAVRLRRMIAAASEFEIKRIGPDGQISAAGSTRIGHELFGGHVKVMNYDDAFQAFVYAGELVGPAYFEPAKRVAAFKGW